MIRPATPADVPALLQLITDLATYEHEPDAVHATVASLTDTLFGPTPHAECVVAEHGGAVAGTALFFTNFSTWSGKPGLYLEDLYITPTARGAGLGRALLQHLAGLVVERGYARLEWSVLDWNEPAIGFYKSLGASAMDEWTVFRLDGDALALLGRALMAWALLILGGLFEVGFTTSLRHVDGFRNVPWVAAFLVAVTLSMGLLERAARTIPLGTAYAVWAGIGALGTAALGILVYHEPASIPRLLLLTGLIGCIIGLKALG